MPMTLRSRNLTCFYCGGRSVQKQRVGLKQWQCEDCEAVNHLDRNGQITDPPASNTPTAKPASSSLRYAHAPTRPLSPPPTSSSTFPATDSLFCQTCLKNQHFYRENLTSYLPSEDSPKYNEYLRSYDKYKDDLERRYPQVCANCAPRVRQQIKNSAYVAKTDHLRRMVEKTKSGGVASRRGAGWRGAVISLGALGRGLAVAFQCGWHAIEVVNLSQVIDRSSSRETLGLEDAAPAIILRLTSYVQMLGIDRQRLFELRFWFQSWMPWILVTALLTTWWNPRIRQKYLGTGGRMVGLGDYYVVQMLALAVRVVAWWALTSTSIIPPTASVAAHTFMMVFPTLMNLVSSRLVKLDTTSRVSFQVSDAMLPQAAQGSALQDASSGNTSLPWQPTGNRPFPVSDLAPAPMPSIFQPLPSTQPQFQPRFQQQHQQQQPQTYRDTNDADSDMMDWTPSTTPLKPTPFNHASSTRNSTSSSTTFLFNPAKQRTNTSIPSSNHNNNNPSPFHGSLPPAPAPPAHLLRRPPTMAPGALRKTSEREKEHFFAEMTGSGRRRGGNATVAEDDDSEDGEVGGGGRAGGGKHGQRKEMTIAPARFFLKEDTLDTGLEAMFDEVFSIRDEPAGRGAAGSGGGDGAGMAVVGRGVGGSSSSGQGTSFGQRLGGLFFG